MCVRVCALHSEFVLYFYARFPFLFLAIFLPRIIYLAVALRWDCDDEEEEEETQKYTHTQTLEHTLRM